MAKATVERRGGRRGSPLGQSITRVLQRPQQTVDGLRTRADTTGGTVPHPGAMPGPRTAGVSPNKRQITTAGAKPMRETVRPGAGAPADTNRYATMRNGRRKPVV